MAYNILSMKYPRSGAGIDSAKWIASIDPADVKLTPAGEKIVEKQKLGVKAVDNAIGELKNLDRQIADLCVKRELAHFDVINLSTAAVAPITKSYSDANNIYKEFLKRGFASDKVKSAVFWIRKMLFDDSQDVYREILCAEIRLAESGDMRLEFIFEHAPSCRCFSIGIPVKRPKPREIAGKWRIGYEIEENYPRRYGGDALCTNIAGIDLVQPYNNGSTETVAYHYDVRVFKKQLDDYVRNGFKTLAENKDGPWRWIGYDSFDSAMGEPPMSAHDYLNEST